MGAEKITMLSSRARKADTRLHMCTFSQVRFVGADLGPSCLQMLSADDTSTDDCGYKWAMKKEIFNCTHKPSLLEKKVNNNIVHFLLE